MKRSALFLLSLLLVFQLTLPAHAIEANALTIPSTMIGYATDDNGNSYELIGELVETTVPYSLNGTYSATYAYDVSMTSTADSPDSGFASHVYLTVYYKLRDGNYYLLTAVSGYWEIQDYNATVTSSTVDYVCGPAGGIYGVSVSNNFYISTGFTEFTDATADFYQVRARLHLTYQMGTSRTWSFTLNNNIV